VAFENTKYHHQNGGIPNAEVTPILLDHVQGQLKGIQIFCINFSDSLPINYTTLKLITYPEVTLGKTKYNHQDDRIPNIEIKSIPLDHVQGQMKGIRLFCISFQDSLPIHYTTLKLITYLEVAFENTKYHHQHGGILNIGITLVPLDHGSRTSEKEPSIRGSQLKRSSALVTLRKYSCRAKTVLPPTSALDEWTSVKINTCRSSPLVDELTRPTKSDRDPPSPPSPLSVRRQAAK
jgi:hypothetical protein